MNQTTETLDPLPLMSLTVPNVPVKTVPKAAQSVPMNTGTASKTVQSVQDTAGAKEKAIQRIAKQVKADLIAGTLVDSRSEKLLTEKIPNRALSGYTSSSDSRKAILDHLNNWGLVEYKNGVAYIVEKYRPIPPPPDPVKTAKTDRLKEVSSALVNLGLGKSEAKQYAESSSGKTVDKHISNALKMVGQK